MMDSSDTDHLWTKKGCTLSDASARKEFGLTQEEIIAALRRGQLQYRLTSMYGNPFFRLLRCEVEALFEKRSGGKELKARKIQNEVARIDKELRKMTRDMTRLRNKRAELVCELEALAHSPSRAKDGATPRRKSTPKPAGRKQKRTKP